MFDEWIETIEYEDIRGLIPSNSMDDAIHDLVDENTSDGKVLRYIKRDPYYWLSGDDKVIKYCISLLKNHLREEKEELDPDEFDDERELNDYFEEKHKEEIEQLKDLENKDLDGDDMMDIIYNYGDEGKVVDWMRDDVISAMVKDMSFEDKVDMLGLSDLSGRNLADTLNELDIVSTDRLYKEFELISDNDEYWYDRKMELEDSEIDESHNYKSDKHKIMKKENAEWDRDEVYNIIMNYEGLYKQAVDLARNHSQTKALRDLSKFAKDVGMDNTPKIRLSDKGALLVAARIMEDYAN